MPTQPNIGIRVDARDIPIDLLCSVVIPILVPQRLGHTGRVALVRARLAVAHLMPCILPALSTATTEEQVIVDLVVCSRVCPIKDSWSGALDPDHDRLILCIGKDMPA